MKQDTKSKDNTFDFTIFKTIMVYVVSIILGPILTFFVTKIVIFNGIFKSSDMTANVSSAVAAVVMLHVIVGMYIYKAYTDVGKAKPVKID